MSSSPASASTEKSLEFGRGLGIFFVVVGVLTIGAGFLAIVYPDITLIVISLLFGINLIIFSSLDLAEVLFDYDEDTAHRVLGAILGVIGLILGLLVLRHPFNSLAVIILAIGIYLIVAGVVGFVRTMSTLTQNRAAQMMVSIATLTFGILILALPQLSLATVAILAGIGLIARGIGAVFIGLLALKAAKLQTV